MKAVFTTGQVAKICKVAPRTVSKWFDSGRLRGYRIPGSQDRRIPRANLLEFLKKYGMPYDDLEDDTIVVLCVSKETEKFARVFDDFFRVIHVQTCFEATVKFQSCHARCIVVDFSTLRMEAPQFCKSFKALPEGAPFVIGIGDAHTDHEGCDRFLHDPFNPVLLCADIKRLLSIAVSE